MSDLYFDWQEYHQKIENLAIKIYQSSWQFDSLVCIAKGGLRVGDILARIFDKPLAIMVAKSYVGKGNQVRGNITFSANIAMLTEKLSGNILLVDDLVDSGITLQETINYLKQNYFDSIVEIRTAVIWYKACSNFIPDYYIDYLKNNPWIHQPFERYEKMNPREIKNKTNFI